MFDGRVFDPLLVGNFGGIYARREREAVVLVWRFRCIDGRWRVLGRGINDITRSGRGSTFG